jgi:hypothetical protein
VPSAGVTDDTNDTYIQTSDGTANGVVISSFVFDKPSNKWISNLPPPSATSEKDFWRTKVGGLLPDGVSDNTDAIIRSGQTTIQAPVGGLSFFYLSSMLGATPSQDLSQTGTNTTTIGVGSGNGEIMLSNTLYSKDTRSNNFSPQSYSQGVTEQFVFSSIVGLSTIGLGIPPNCALQTVRRIGYASDFSLGNIVQIARFEDGREYYRVSINGTTWGGWMLKNKIAKDFHLQDLLFFNGNLKVSLNGEINWTGEFSIYGLGKSMQQIDGRHTIIIPPSGATIQAITATRNVVVATPNHEGLTGGIPLAINESLWYKVPRGTQEVSVATNFRIVEWGTDISAGNGLMGTSNITQNSEEWVRICTRTSENTFHFGNGQQLGLGGHLTNNAWNTTAQNKAMLGTAILDGYVFVPGGVVDAISFGFTGKVVWNVSGINDRTVSEISVSDSDKVNGTVIYGLNGAANTTWRLMNNVEKPQFFGGATRGRNPILATSTTVVTLNFGETLYWVPGLGGSSTKGTWIILGQSLSTNSFFVPIHWIPIAHNNLMSVSGIHSFITGSKHKLLPGEFLYGGNMDEVARQKRDTVQFSGTLHCRSAPASFFSGITSNQISSNSYGVMIHWSDNGLLWLYGATSLNSAAQPMVLNVPDVGFQIPLAKPHFTATRVVQLIGGKKYVPLSFGEALYFIPPQFGNSTSQNTDYVISSYTEYGVVPSNAILIAKNHPNTASYPKVWFCDGQYITGGTQYQVGVGAEYDHSHFSSEWRDVTIAGGTSPNNTAPLPALSGIVGHYPLDRLRYRNIYRQGNRVSITELRGIISLTGSTLPFGSIAFIPGIYVELQKIRVNIVASTLDELKIIPEMVEALPLTVGTEKGVVIRRLAYSSSLANPYYTLGVNGGASAVGTLIYMHFDNISLF